MKNIIRWARMKETTTFDVGIFTVEVSHPANYLGWLGLYFTTMIIVGCFLLAKSLVI